MAERSFAGCSAGAPLAAGTSVGAVALLPAVLLLRTLSLPLWLSPTPGCLLGCIAFSASESAALVSRKVFCASSARCTSSQHYQQSGLLQAGTQSVCMPYLRHV